MGFFRLIGNILWFIGGGLISFLTWLLLGVALCLTLIGIPFGLQCLKLATLVLAPFGKEVVYGGKTGSFLMNILWLPFGLALSLEQVVLGLIYCLTLIGIPAGLQAFKMAKLALMPFGTEVRKKGKKTETSAAPAAMPVEAAPVDASATQTPASAAAAPAEPIPAAPAMPAAPAQPVTPPAQPTQPPVPPVQPPAMPAAPAQPTPPTPPTPPVPPVQA